MGEYQPPTRPIDPVVLGQIHIVVVLGGVPAVEDDSRLLGDAADDRRGADGLGGVMQVHQEDQHAAEHEHEGCRDGQLGDEGRGVRGPAHGPQDDHRVDERRDEHAQGDLVEPVTQERAQHPGRELAARQLQHDDRDREHQRGERDHRADDR